jgi:hypothetical protein
MDELFEINLDVGGDLAYLLQLLGVVDVFLN